MLRPLLRAVAGALAAIATLTFTGCSSATGNATPEVIKFGVPPGEADPAFLEGIQPVADLIEDTTGIPVEMTKTSDYLAIVEAMRSGLLDVAMFSPMPTVIAQDVANVTPLVAALGAPYSTYVICAPDAGVTELKDIQNKSMAFVDPGSTSGNYIPRLMLKQAGIDLEALESTFAGGHDVAAISVKQGSTDCAAVASMLIPMMVEGGAITEDDFTVIAESDPLPISTVIIARDGLSQEIKDKITTTFVEQQPQALLESANATELVRAKDADWTIFLDAAQELGLKLEDVE